MTVRADGYLLAVHCPQEPIEAGRDPFVAQFPNMSDMVHLNLFLGFATNTTGFSQLGASSEMDQGSHHVHAILVSSLKGQSVFRPVSVEIKTDLAIRFSSLPFDEN